MSLSCFGVWIKVWPMVDMRYVVYAVACIILLYLILALTVWDKMFGQRRKRERKEKKSKFHEEKEESTSEVQQTNGDEQQKDGKKLKLPMELDELEFVEEKLSVDENIMSSLTLGPSSIDNAKNPSTDTGSWYKKEFNGCFDGSETSSLPSGHSNSLIWPARFHIDGATLRERNITNDSKFSNKTPERFGEFSDCESDLAQAENYNEERNNLHPMKRRRKERTMKSCCNCFYVERVVLVCSLTLNIIFFWMWKNS